MAYLRDNANLIKGDELWLFLSTTENQEVPTCFATQHSLNRSLSTTSVSSKDHGNTSYIIPGEGTWTCSTEALMSMTTTDANSMSFVEIMDAFHNNNLVYVKFGKISNYTARGIVNVNGATPWSIATPYWTGKGYITSLQASGGHGDSATFSIEITGVGPLQKINEDIEYDVSLVIGSSTLIDQITLSPTSANAGDTITVTPNDAQYYDPNVVITTSPSTAVTWNDYTTNWTFTMPASDTTVTASLATRYSVTKIAGHEDSYDVEPNTPVLPGSYVHLVPHQDSTYIPANNYAMSVETVNSGNPISVYWIDDSSYWQFEMPAQNVNTYIYQTI